MGHATVFHAEKPSWHRAALRCPGAVKLSVISALLLGLIFLAVFRPPRLPAHTCRRTPPANPTECARSLPEILSPSSPEGSFLGLVLSCPSALFLTMEK